jgi:AhpD family alkylhydroperoxidase
MEQKFNKRLFTLKEFTKIVNLATYSAMKYKTERKLISKSFEHHIMLAVTEVNGCQVCTYAHTKQALESGSSKEEIAGFLLGDLSNSKKEEIIGLLFAQHYADVDGNYDKKIFDKLIEEYGIEKAYGILANIRIIMMGNAYGIAYGCLKERLSRRKVKGSKLLTELLVLASIVVLLPVLLIKNIFTKKSRL